MRIDCTGVAALQAELIAKKYKNNRPGLERPDWGGLECTVVAPVGNRIIFAESE